MNRFAVFLRKLFLEFHHFFSFWGSPKRGKFYNDVFYGKYISFAKSQFFWQDWLETEDKVILHVRIEA